MKALLTAALLCASWKLVMLRNGVELMPGSLWPEVSECIYTERGAQLLADRLNESISKYGPADLRYRADPCPAETS